MLTFDGIDKKKKLLLLSFFMPFTILGLIYIFMGVFPFGNSTLLTIDLGQQYVDFYSYYRHTILHEPQAFFYSFVKGIGGDMVGLWGYYLNSPFNLLLLLFPQRLLAVGVTLLILLKISCSGLSFAYLLIKRFDGNNYLVPAFALSYALMGYTIANQLNVMWLDGLVLLPLIILGLEKLIDGESGLTYSLSLALMLFSHYYIGYMICLFLCFYFIFALSKQETSHHFKGLLKQTVRFAFYSILAATLAAFSLLPNFISLLGGKASYASDTINWGFDYPFIELLSKFYVGSFNFDQMPSGYPNLFVGSLALIGFLFYFFNKNFPLREKLTSVILVIIFFLSMNSQYLNKIWHGFQNPIWYPYRFSFLVCFFFILNGYRSIKKLDSFPLTFACLLLLAQTASALYVLDFNFDFVIPIQVLVTALFLIAMIILLLLKEVNYKWMPIVLLLLVSIEMTTNAAINLSRLSYVKMSPFNDYQLVLDDLLQGIRPQDDEFYRIEKVFQRSKNDSFQANYPSASHFSSTFEKEVPELYGYLGFPDGNGFVSYSSGTLFTDAFFAIKYLAQNNDLPSNLENNAAIYKIFPNSTRRDFNYYQKVNENYRTSIYQNPHAFSLAFAIPDAIKDVDLKDNDPIGNQERLLQAMTIDALPSSYYQEIGIESTVTSNVSSLASESVNQTYTKNDSTKDASIEFQFTPQTNESYYLTLDSRIDDEDTTLTLDGERLAYYKTYRNDQIINVASGQKGETIRFGFDLLEDSLTIRDLRVFRFRSDLFEELADQIQDNGLNISTFSQTHIEGTLTTSPDHTLFMMTIPYSEGWELHIDGQKIETYTVLNGLIGADIAPGEHTITLSYMTPYLKEGIAISIAGSVTVLIIILVKRRKK